MNKLANFFSLFILILNVAEIRTFAVEPPPPVALNFRVGAGATEGQGIATDANGVIYATGQYAGTGTFGSFTLTNGGSFDYYLSAYNATGQVLWAKRAGMAGADFGSDVIVDHDGNIVVAGVIEGTNDFHGETNVVGFGRKDMFLAKYNVGGQLLWVRLAGGANDDQAFDVAVDRSGNYLVAGRIGGVATFGNTNAGSGSQTRCVLAKYNPAGQFLWVRDVAGTGSTETCGVAADGNGNSFVTGLSVSPNGPFVAKYDSGGSLLWKQVAAGNSFFDEGSSVDIDAVGNVYVAGRFTGAALTFGSISLTNPGAGARGFIGKFDPSGNPLWVRSSGARGFDVDAADDGTIYVAGFSSATATNLGNVTMSNQGGLDMFAAKLTTGGDVVWVKSAGTGNNDLARAITHTASGSVFVIGEGGSELFGSPNFPGGVFIVELRATAVPNPSLSATVSGRNIVVSWPSNFAGYAIETTSTLATPFQQGAVVFTPVGGQTNTFSAPKPASNLFIRLVKP